MVARTLIALAVAGVLSGCGEKSVIAGEAEPADTIPAVLDAVLDPMDAVVTDFGDAWEPVDRWSAESPAADWDTGCSGFDELDRFARSGPETSVWRSEHADMVYRVQSLGIEAPAHARLVATVADVCPTITPDGATVTLTAVDSDAVFGHEGENITTSAIGLDALPVASPETDATGPVFEPDRPTWQVTLTRYNTVAQITYAPASGTAGPAEVDFSIPPEELIQVVGLVWEGLSAAPVEFTGPVEEPNPPPTAGDQVIDDVVLRLGLDCFENSAISVDGFVFRLIDPLPETWIGLIEVRGRATVEGELATFVADDGTTLRLTSGASETECTYWEFDENPPDEDTGRLDCDHPAADLIESTHPDTGQGPEALAEAEVPGTAALEQDDPLIWWAVDSSGNVLAGIFLGDAEGADYQIFRCRP